MSEVYTTYEILSDVRTSITVGKDSQAEMFKNSFIICTHVINYNGDIRTSGIMSLLELKAWVKGKS